MLRQEFTISNGDVVLTGTMSRHVFTGEYMMPTSLQHRIVAAEDLLDIWTYEELNSVAFSCGSEEFLVFSSRSID